MATGTAPNAASPPEAPHPYADMIEEHVQRTQGYLRGCDIVGALITIAVFVLGYLLAMALIDHWVWPGGLGKGGRILACLVMVGLVGVYAWRTLLPHLFRRINPVYAADRLERAQPSLMNSLVNLLTLRADKRPVSDAVMRGLEHQAAAGIAHLPAEAAVDRAKLLRIAYVLVGVLSLAALYVLFSPKSPFVSVARILIPWADIAPVTRVRIENVAPGTDNVYRGDPVTVTAEIRGLRDDEPVTLRCASTDGQTDNQSVPMYRREGETAHSCVLPPDAAGMQRDLVYHIEAGDAPKKEYRLTVVPAPTIQIEDIEYRYPAYTRMAPLVVERQGDIKAIEGTQVVIRAKASEPIASAALELAGVKDLSLPMQAREMAARAELLLKMVKVEGQREPEYTSYKLGMTNSHGDRNREPAAYRIEITHDLGPLVDVIEPKLRDVEVPADKELSIEVRARDADFALSDARLVATRKGERLLDESLLTGLKVRLDQPVRLAWKFVPAKYNLKPGDEVQFRAVAIDNKTPQANRQQTPEYRIQIVAPEAMPQPQPRDDMKRDDMKKDGPADQQRDPNGGKSPPGEQGNAGNKQGAKDEAKKNPDGGQGEPLQEKGKQDGAGNKQEGTQQEGAGAPGKNEGQPQSGGKDEQQGSDGAGGSNAQGSEGQQASDPADDTEAVQQIVEHLEKKEAEKKQAEGKPSSAKNEQEQVASTDKQDPRGSKQPEKQESKDKQQGKQESGKQESGKQESGKQESGKQEGSKEQGGKQEGSKQEGGKQEGGKQEGGKQGSQQQGGGQGKQGQPQSGGSQSQQQGNSSGSPEGQKSPGQQTGASSSDSKGQGNHSGEGKQQSAEQKSNPSGGEKNAKSQDGMGKADAKQASERTGDQSAQKQPGQNQPGSQLPQDKSASAQKQPGDKQDGQGQPSNQTADNKKPENNSGEKPAGDKPNPGDQGQGNIADKIGEKMKKDGNTQPENKQQPGDKQPGDQVAARDPNQKEQSPKQPGDGQPKPKASNQNQSGEKQAGEGQPQQKQGEKAEGGERGMNPQERNPQPSSEKQPKSPDGGKSQSGGPQGRQQDDGNSSDGKRPDEKAKETAQKSGETSDNKASGSPKDKAQDQAHAPNNTPGKKENTPSDSQSNENDAKNKEHQRPSATSSEQRGEKAGKGQEGQGQQASGAGSGAAGKNQAADDGGSKSQQSGPGDKSDRAGKQQKSDQATGQGSKEAGDAQSGTPEGMQPNNGQQQQKKDDSQPGDPNPNAPTGMQPGAGQPTDGDTSGTPTGTGGRPGGGQSGPSSSSSGGEYVPGSEQANLDYAKKATDLTLSYLQDQLAKGKVDDKLRKRLGWTDEEFQSLLKRMQAMRDKGTDAKARPEDKLAYEQWLKSLGLRPGTGAIRTGKQETKALKDSRDDAPVTVPRDLREQHEAFRRGLLEKSQ